MRQDFSWTVDVKGGITQVALKGDITERADFSRLLPELSEDLILDLADVQRINSCGLREWLSFVRALEGSGKRFALERCSVPVVAQLNMISAFPGGGSVRSVYAPYFCPQCNEEHQRLITADDSAPAQLSSDFPCPTCGSQLEFDDLPDHFLSFLERSPSSPKS
jgi:anti-anti-sigma regulatory factor